MALCSGDIAELKSKSDLEEVSIKEQQKIIADAEKVIADGKKVQADLKNKADGYRKVIELKANGYSEDLKKLGFQKPK